MVSIFKILLILSFLSVQTFAWTLTLGGSVFNGRNNQVCTQKSAAKGTRLSWKRGILETCCVRLYADGLCSKQLILKIVFIILSCCICFIIIHILYYNKIDIFLLIFLFDCFIL